MDLFLNELSLPSATDRYAVDVLFSDLARLYRVASSKGFAEIRVPECFLTHAFTEGYSFFQWVGDRDFDEDRRTLLKSKLTTTPAIEALLRRQEDDTGKAFECRWEGQLATGLGAASTYMFDTLAISWATPERWQLAQVPVVVTVLDEAECQEKACHVRHAGTEAHLAEHEAWLRQKRQIYIPNGQVLWLKRLELFPNLVFCDHVRGQITAFSGAQPMFIQLKKRLQELEDYARWRPTGIFDAEVLHNVDTESNTRRRGFANELIQRCPDGKSRLFDWHSRFTGGEAGRIHFYPLEDSGKIIIGSIANQNEIK